MSIYYNIYNRCKKRLQVVLVAVLLLTAGLTQAQVVIKGNVYGGGLEGQVKNPKAASNVFGNSSVTINGGTVESSVFGGGKGVESNETSGLVEGNTTVTMTGGVVERSIYGGGSLGSVGTFSFDSLVVYTEGLHEGTNVHLPTLRGWVPQTGRATVSVTGGTVGLRGSLMPWTNHDPLEDDRGWIFCGSQGAADSINHPRVIAMGVVKDTHLEISGSALVTASAYGGCENGLVLDSTFVEIKGGQIGTGLIDTVTINNVLVGTFADPYTDQNWEDAINAVKDGTIATALAEGGALHDKFYMCDSWPYGYDHDNDPTTPKKYDVYDIYYDSLTDPNDPNSHYRPDNTDSMGSNGQSYFGNVFGGGSGYYPIVPGIWRRSAGRVNGNTRVEITGGHILTSVYGGNEVTDVMGRTTIKMSDGTIGVPRSNADIQDHPVLCNLFGSGKGDQRVWANKWTNVDSTIVEFTGGTIFGSIFGGGEDGHVLGSTYVTVNGDNALIGTLGYSGFEGHVYGSGRGFSGDALTAGNVGGNTNITIESGTILGSIYGGGRNASVGPKLWNPEDLLYGQMQPDDEEGTHGHTYVTINGGVIGNDYESKLHYIEENLGGNVYGGSMGTFTLLDGSLNPMWPRMSKVKTTNVTIDGENTIIKGNVFGGCKLGTIVENTSVTIKNGTIWRSVYGSGYGSDNNTYVADNVVIIETPDVHDSTYQVTPRRHAGRVYGNTKVSIEGGWVKKNVYGGGSMASTGTITNEIVVQSEIDSLSIGWPVRLTYKPDTGADTVLITGGRIGITGNDFMGPWQADGTPLIKFNGAYIPYNSTIPAHVDSLNAAREVNGQVFGGGRGSVGNRREMAELSDYVKTVVTVNYASTASESGFKPNASVSTFYSKYSEWTDYGSIGCIVSNLYGASENGHVHDSTYVTLTNGLIGGSLFGGGKGTEMYLDDLWVEDNSAQGYHIKEDTLVHSVTAGKVFGKTYVTMDGGHVLGNVYGGGEFASVGKGNYLGYGEHSTAEDSTNMVLKSGQCYVAINGGTVGTATWNHNGNVFGSSKGLTYKNVTATPRYNYSRDFFLGYTNFAYVTIGKADGATPRIYGSVFGGGENGHVRFNTEVTINKGEIGVAYNSELSEEERTHRGNIYGAGQGIDKIAGTDDYCNSAGSVTLNTKVTVNGGTIHRNVYGGGSLASVGPPPTGYNPGTSLNEVIIKGGTIGEVVTTVTEGVTTYSNYGGDVFGACRGIIDAKAPLASFATSSNTKVTLDTLRNGNTVIDQAFVIGNVYGGGELGQVKHTTQVDVKAGYVGTIGYTWKHDTDHEAKMDSVFHKTGGSVFGGGRGDLTDPVTNREAALVTDTTHVIISGGHVQHSVYGGGEVASVGLREQHNYKSNGTWFTDYLPKQSKAHADSTGVAMVTIRGGQVGPAPKKDDTHNVEIGLNGTDGYVFGGGKGIGEDYINPFDPAHPYSGKDYYAIADVNNTYVTVDMPMPANATDTTNRIWGSTFGGAEDGHVLGSARTYYKNGLMGTTGTTTYDGNIFGGGRNYSKKNYNAGRVRVNDSIDMCGGQIYGSIFGGGRLALTGIDLYGNILPDTANVKHGNTFVKVSGGTVGNNDTIEEWIASSMGDVYGAGKGDTIGIYGHPKASALLISLVKNAEVLITDTVIDGNPRSPRILGSVFGGGEMACVGQFTWNIGEYSGVTNIGDITPVPGTGKTKVTVNGGVIGADKAQMRLDMVDGTGKYDLKYNDDRGHVFGGSEGWTDDPAKYAVINPSSGTPGIHNNKRLIDLMALVGETQVTIGETARKTTLVKGSVYGGSMNGHVLRDTKVTVKGGQIGAGYNTQTGVELARYDEKMFLNPVHYFTRHSDTSDIRLDSALYGCVHWKYDSIVQRPYDPVAIKDSLLYNQAHPDDQRVVPVPSNGETWFGSVYGGGSGYYPYIVKNHNETADSCVWNPEAGKVYGNSEVVITGGHILSNVYGGAQNSDVGSYSIADAAYHNAHPTVPKDEMYCTSGGWATVTMSGGTVGVPRTIDSIARYPLNGDLYGGCQGDFREELKLLGNVDSTQVTISGTAVVYGSVFGGSENGQVIDSTKVIVQGGVIGTTGLSGEDGSVYGGGQGSSYYTSLADTTGLTLYFYAGRVGGNTHVKMTSGTVLGNVYGGGSIAQTGVGKDGSFSSFVNTSVTPYVYDSTFHGRTLVEINGGTIGDTLIRHGYDLLMCDNEIGNVYGGGRGEPKEFIEDDFGRSANAVVKISGSPYVFGSVFGGGQMANVGHWNSYASWYTEKTGSTHVSIQGTPTIGTALEFDYAYSKGLYGVLPNWTYYDTIKGMRMIEHTCSGNVVGAGQGDVTLLKGGVVTGLEHGHCRTTEVNINMTNPTNGVGGGRIMSSVYGGAEQGAVWGSTKVTVEGGVIGTTGIVADSLKTTTNQVVKTIPYSFGSVFGGSYGSDSWKRFTGDPNFHPERPTHLDSINNLAGRVYGNTVVNIKGGYIRGNVYGGGDMASVGIWDSVTDDNDKLIDITPKADPHRPEFKGNAVVTVTGGEIGPLDDTGLNAYVFGGGKGFSNDPDTLRKTFANVDSTFVTVSGGKIWGSVFGGGNDAHTLGSAKIEVHAGADIGKDGLSTWDGNIFGGGRNFLNSNHSNGRVAGNIDITMDGGTIQGTIFGGGRLAVTGVDMNAKPYLTNATDYVYDSVNHGLVTINVSGTNTSIGNSDGLALLCGSDESVGDIFGSGKGDTKAYDDIMAGRVANTKINIKGSPRIYGSVFGGGEMASIGYWHEVGGKQVFYGNSGAAEVTIGENATDGIVIGTDLEFRHDYATGTYNVGTTGYEVPSYWTVFDNDHKLIHTCTGNVYGGSQGDVDTLDCHWVSMGRSRTSKVTINGGTIKSRVFGGAEQGSLGGNTYVTVNGGTIGSWANTDDDDNEVPATLENNYLFGGVYGGGYGSHNPIFNGTTMQNGTAIVNDSTSAAHLNPASGEKLWTANYLAGRTYGDTRVDILGGTIQGDVYGGASYAYVGGYGNSPSGNVQVNIGLKDQPGHAPVGSATFLGNVYGSNNHSGTPYGNVRVDVYHTAHTLKNTVPPTPVGGWTADSLLANANGLYQYHYPQEYAIKEVFAGGNLASYTPNQAPGRTIPRNATVHVHYCENTIEDLYGGSNAADIGTSLTSANDSVVVDGGRFYRTFGGGKGTETYADVHGTASTRINAGVIQEVYGGGNHNGIIDEIDLEITHANADVCDDFIYDVFGGNNEAEAFGDIVSVINCGDGYQYEFYGGNNVATIYGNVTTHVFGGETVYLFGGSKGSSTTAAHIRQFPSYDSITADTLYHHNHPEVPRKYSDALLEYMGYPNNFNTSLVGKGGNVTLNLFGGRITEAAFGGSDVNGTIDGKITVNVFDAETNCGLDLKNLYGGGRTTSYDPIYGSSGTERITPEVNVIHGIVKGNVFGGGMGATATTTASPLVNIGYDVNVFGDPTVQNSFMDILYDTIHKYCDTIKPAPATSYSWPEPAVSHYADTVKHEVYGGGELAGVTGNTRVNMFRGAVGTHGTSGTDGNIFGGGQGTEGSLTAGRVGGNTVVEMRDGTVMGNIYGGGRLALTGVDANGAMQADIVDNPATPDVNEAKTFGSTKVMIKGGTVGNVDEIEEFTDFSMGNIYGSGKGLLEDKNGTHSVEAILLSGLTKNTTIEISDTLDKHTHVYGIVLGGGELASVGHYNLTKDTETGKITNIAVEDGTGKATVRISGGVIGGDRSQMRYDLADPSDSTNYWLKYNDDLGYVYGGGEGWSDDPNAYPMVQESNSPITNTSLLDLIATVQSTEVTITSDTIKSGTNSGVVRKPWVKASVFGGSESGHVRGNTKVTIADGQIGAGYYVKNGQVFDSLFAENQFINPLTTPVTNANSLNGTYHWDYGVIEGNSTVYNPFDPALIRNGYNHYNTNTYDYVPSDGKSWFGNVFGGGSGWFPYVKEVSTASDTIIQFKSFWNPLSGKVWGNTEVNITGGHILNNVYGANESTDVGGKATIKISGGTVGVPRSPAKVKERPLISYVFGGGAGDPRHDFDTITNVASTDVQINGGTIYGSVYGGAEDGHVLGNTLVTISETDATDKPTIIGSTGRSDADGHVFGGGRNFIYSNLAAGSVVGNVTINMTAGYLMGNLYGGGRLGMTGMYPNGDTIPGFAHGYTTLNISGGTIGSAVDTLTIGNVFGGGKGKVDSDEGWWVNGVFYSYTQLPNHFSLGRVKETSITISNSARIHGNVYGGGEIAKVMRNTNVTVEGGTIGSALTEGNPAKTRYNGSVFGGSKGYTSGWAQYTPDPGEVFGNTTVRIEGGQVLENVYGGGEMASVVGNAHVNISGGQVGEEQEGQAEVSGGNVYGGGFGRAGDDYVDHANVDSAKVNISGGYVIGAVFGGGDNGHVLKSTVVNMTNGIVGKKNTLEELVTDEFEQAATHIYTGSLIGGGRGIDTDENGNYSDITGIVYGNTNVTVSGGLVRHGVYGGGGLSHVGTIDSIHDGLPCFKPGTGITKVSVSGGLIGPSKADLVGPFGNGISAADSIKYVDTVFKYLGGNAGWVFGAGCGLAGDTYKGLTFNDSTFVTISGSAQVVGAVYGGGENGHVARNTRVDVNGGTIGAVPLHGDSTGMANGASLEYRIDGGPYDGVTVHLAKKDGELNENEYGIGKHVFRGSVFGGGKGTDYTDAGTYSMYAGRVYGNTHVNVSGNDTKIYNRVYGGGAMSSVGKFTYYNTLSAIPDPGVPLTDSIQRISYVQGTGDTHVTISGGTIGMGSTATDGNNHGFVIGGGRGLAGYPGDLTAEFTNVDPADQVVRMAYVNNTNVAINGGTVKGNVYGGSVSGHVYGDAHVIVDGGTIGYTYQEGGQTKVHGTWHSNVFGGGGGQKPYKKLGKDPHLSITAGRVYGNTKVEVKSGTVYHNVYGGGPIASVGTYDLRILRPAVAPNTGKTEVIITGGTIGLDGEDNGHVFGSGHGYPAPALNFLDSLSYAVETHVTIGTESTPNVTNTPTVWGSVYGSGENGHTYLQANVNIHSGTVNHSVYGAGEGDDSYTGDDNKPHYNPIAGCVQGNTEVKMTGGLVKGNVYGGGRLASVGVLLQETQLQNAQYNYPDTVVWIAQMSGVDPTAFGNTRVEITGGTIGYGDLNSLTSGRKGFVFGGSKGMLLNPETYQRWTDLANVSTSHVIVGGGDNNANVKSSVYGGSEVGRVLDSTWVEILSKAEIGEASETMAFHRGNVFGGGSGNDSINTSGSTTGTVGHGYVFMREAGRVNGNARVDMKGGHVYNSVYGGCEVTSVGIYDVADQNYHNTHPDVPKDALYWKSGGRTTVNISGGNVGWKRDADLIKNKPRYGYVYGAGKGDPGTYFNTWTNVKDAYVTVTTPTTGTIVNDTIFGCVFGGGEEGHVLGNTHVKIQGDTLTTWIGTYGTTGADGNVFGSGRGKSPVALTAGGVGGNTRVDIEGGRMLGSIFGGGNNSSVGIWFTFDSIPDPENPNQNIEHPSYGVIQEGDHGYVTVNISGGTIGHEDTDGRTGGNVYGGSRGTPGKPGSVNQRMAKVKETHVNITQASGVTTAMPAKQTHIMGSVFGSGEDGHVLKDTYVTVSNGQIGGKKWVPVDNEHEPEVCDDIYHGNVYGSGRGLDTYVVTDNNGDTVWIDPSNHELGPKRALSVTAGLVSGNTNIEITGGRITRSVYGGGNLSSVGDPDETPDPSTGEYHTGLATVNILGGYVGILRELSENRGNVFGSGHGGIGGEYTELAYVKNTHVTIDSVAQIYGSVFGGGEDGHVRKNTLVDVKGGTIGESNPDALHGNVYGGGRDIVNMSGTISPTAGEVFGHTTVNIMRSDKKDASNNYYTPTIWDNVYGGGSRSVVSEYKVVNISDGTIKGNVFGGSRDIPVGDRTNLAPRWVNMWGGTIEGNLYGCSHNSVDGDPDHDQDFASFINLSGGTIKGSVFGAGYGSTVKGSVGILIGKNAIDNDENTEIGSANTHKLDPVPMGKLDIQGSVYAGGDQVSGSTWGQYAVTGYSNIYIDGEGYNTQTSTGDNCMNIGSGATGGGIFGSSTNCEAGKESHNILVRKFGTRINATKSGEMERASRSLTTIQRAGIVMLDEVNVALTGIKDISHPSNDTLYGVMKVDDGFYVANASGIVLGATNRAALMDSIKEVKSLHAKSSTASIYQNMNVNSSSNWEWIGIKGNTPATAKLYYTETAQSTPLTYAQENVILFNDTSKMVVRYNHGGTTTFGELQGFFRMQSPLTPYGTKTFAEARRKLTFENGGIGEGGTPDNINDGGFLSYNTEHNFYNLAGNDGGAEFTNTKQYPYTNVDHIHRDEVYYYREWLIRQVIGHKWYVDGRSRGIGVDDKSDGRGLYPDIPKKSITRDYNGNFGVYAGTFSGGSEVTFKKDEDAIYVVGAVNDSLEWGTLNEGVYDYKLNKDPKYELKLYRYPGVTGGSSTDQHVLSSSTATDPGANYGALIETFQYDGKPALTLNNVIVDGLYGYASFDAQGNAIPSTFNVSNDTMPLIVAHKQSKLILCDSTTLKNGYNHTNDSMWYIDSDYTPYDASGVMGRYYHGGAIFVDKTATVTVKDTVLITGNKQYLKIGDDERDIECNVYLPTFDTKLQFTRLNKGTRVGITSPRRNNGPTYRENTLSPIAIATDNSVVDAWKNCNFLDDQNWFFANGYVYGSSWSSSGPASPRTTYLDRNGDGDVTNTLYFGWTWANVVRTQPDGYEVSGTTDDIISINTKEGLAWLISQSASMNGQTATNFEGKTIKQAADLSMGQYIWVPIGDLSVDTLAPNCLPFAGTYDGQGHTIDSIFIGKIGFGDGRYERSNYGLFGRVRGGTVKRTFVIGGEINPAVKPSTSKDNLDESYLPEEEPLFDDDTIMEMRDNMAVTEPYNIGGLVGYLDGGTVCNSEAADTIVCFERSTDPEIIAGGLVGQLKSGEIHSSMAMPVVVVKKDSKGLAGGLVGNATGGSIQNSFANSCIGVSDGNEYMIFGGLLGKNDGGSMSNCYMDLHLSDNGYPPQAARYGSIVGINNSDASTIGNCYVIDSTVNFNYTSSGSLNSVAESCKHYSDTINSNSFGYMYSDNKVDGDTAMFLVLNRWVDSHNVSDYKYTRWARPALPEINGDLPVLMINNLDGTTDYQGELRSVATISGKPYVLQYGGPVRDDNQLNGATGRMKANDALFVYGDITEASGVTPPVSKTKISIHEDVAILHAGDLADYDSTYVGISFDNSYKLANSTPGLNNGLGEIGGGGLPTGRDWHMFSSPLSDAPLGFDYLTHNTDTYTSGDYSSTDHYNNPWVSTSTEFNWLSSPGSNECYSGTGHYRYWMDKDKDGYFPYYRGTLFSDPDDSDKPWASQINNIFVVDGTNGRPSDECLPPDGLGNYINRYPYGMDFFTWTEPDYHWINFKRNGPNHWHSDTPHVHLDYKPLGVETTAYPDNKNEENLIPGRGYMASIMSETLLQSHGKLNKDEVSIKLTNYGYMLQGWNLVGNPYHGYLDFDKLTNYGGNKKVFDSIVEGGSKVPFYVVYDADSTIHDCRFGAGFLYYPKGGSRGGAYAGPVLHPHQGFYLKAKTDDTLHFTESMLVTRAESAGSHFRDERPAYPLVNLFLSSDHGCNDVTVIEFNRPETGGAPKLKELRVGNGLFYAHFADDYYAALFAPEGIDRVPLWFEAKEDDIYTITWDKANGDFHSMWLIDNIAGVQYDMLRNDTYSFEGHVRDYPSRFLIVFDITGLEDSFDIDKPFAFHDGDEWVVTGDGTLQFVDVLGHILKQESVHGQTRMALPQVANGVYMFRLMNDKGVKMQKVIMSNYGGGVQ